MRTRPSGQPKAAPHSSDDHPHRASVTEQRLQEYDTACKKSRIFTLHGIHTDAYVVLLARLFCSNSRGIRQVKQTQGRKGKKTGPSTKTRGLLNHSPGHPGRPALRSPAPAT